MAQSIKKEHNVKYARYTCLDCGAEDQAKYFLDELDIAPSINCWDCGSGRAGHGQGMAQSGIELPGEGV